MVRKAKQRYSTVWLFGMVFFSLLVIALFSLIFLRTVQAQSEAWAKVMDKANALYESGDYASAIETYQQVIDGGMRHSAVYYNLGNAYCRSGDLGRAVLNYERARRLAPRDEDIRANLAFARTQVADQLPIAEDGAVWAALTGWHRALTVNEIAWVAWALFVALCALGVVGFLSHRRRPGLISASVIGIVLALALASLGFKVYGLNQDHAVIVAPEVGVYSGPDDTYMLEFTLHAGTMMTIEEEREDWVRGEISGDFQGWLPAEAVELVR